MHVHCQTLCAGHWYDCLTLEFRLHWWKYVEHTSSDSLTTWNLYHAQIICNKFNPLTHMTFKNHCSFHTQSVCSIFGQWPQVKDIWAPNSGDCDHSNTEEHMCLFISVSREIHWPHALWADFVLDPYTFLCTWNQPTTLSYKLPCWQPNYVNHSHTP